MLSKVKWIVLISLVISLSLFSQTFSGVALSGVETFNPRKIPSLVAWWRADVGLVLDSTTTTNTVSKVFDMSGNTNNLTQSTKANQPFILTNNLNGYPVFLFSSQRRFLCDSIVNVASGVNTPQTVFIVSNSDVVDANSPIISWANATNNTPIVTLRGPANGSPTFTLRYTRNDDSSASTAPVVNGLTSNAWHIAAVSFSGSSANLLVDTNSASTASSLGQITITTFTVGMKHGTTFTNPWAGRLAEVLIYNTSLSSNQMNLVSSYLNSKYKIY